jgi:hypothetical protein
VPLITITTTAERYPLAVPSDDTPLQALTAEFGSIIPEIIIGNAEELHLEADTPLEGVQVDYRLYHPRVVNGADFWIVAEFTESGLSKEEEIEVRQHFKVMCRTFFGAHYETGFPRLATDIFWRQGRGFLIYDKLEKEW